MLSALRDHERASYSGTASPTAAVDWLRALREVEARLHDLASKTQCTARAHREGIPSVWPNDNETTTDCPPAVASSRQVPEILRRGLRERPQSQLGTIRPTWPIDRPARSTSSFFPYSIAA